jgi:uncharacterized damage-inducible protein DinB
MVRHNQKQAEDPMLTTYLAAILKRDLQALSREIQSFPDDDLLWKTPEGVTNSAGNLALHLTGNLRYYVGAKLGNTDYVRDREAEFGSRGLARDELVAHVEQTIEVVGRVLPQLTEEALVSDFPEAVGGQTLRTKDFLFHLTTHLAYHLGQIDYHRRFVTGKADPIGAVSVKELNTARSGS